MPTAGWAWQKGSCVHAPCSSWSCPVLVAGYVSPDLGTGTNFCLLLVWALCPPCSHQGQVKRGPETCQSKEFSDALPLLFSV